MSLVSIVIATYNGSEFIAEQLLSILEQTYHDFEVIIIDDCSNDSTTEIIQKIFYEQGFSNYLIVSNESNIGVTKSFEKGILKSKGRYVAICDQDDIWFRNKLESSLNFLKKNNADIVHSPSLILNGKTKTTSIFPVYRNFEKLFAVLTHNNARGATLLFRKKFVERLIPFSIHDLYDKWIYFLGMLYGNVVYLEKPLHFYRIHRNNYIGDKHGFKSKNDLVLKLNSEISFYKHLHQFVKTNKKVNSTYSYDDIQKEISNIINFLNDTYTCVNDKNIVRCLYKFISNIWGREFNIKEKMTYFYYYLLKFV